LNPEKYSLPAPIVLQHHSNYLFALDLLFSSIWSSGMSAEEREAKRKVAVQRAAVIATL
jgi:hypothetical protein